MTKEYRINIDIYLDNETKEEAIKEIDKIIGSFIRYNINDITIEKEYNDNLCQLCQKREHLKDRDCCQICWSQLNK